MTSRTRREGVFRARPQGMRRCGESLALRAPHEGSGPQHGRLPLYGLHGSRFHAISRDRMGVPWSTARSKTTARSHPESSGLSSTWGRRTRKSWSGGDGGTYDIGLTMPIRSIREGSQHNLCLHRQRSLYEHGHTAERIDALRRIHDDLPRGQNQQWQARVQKDLMHILAAHGSPIPGHRLSGLSRRLLKKGQDGAGDKGATFINVWVPCVPGWRIEPEATIKVAKLGVETGATPLYEIINGKHKLNMPQDRRS